MTDDMMGNPLDLMSAEIDAITDVDGVKVSQLHFCDFFNLIIFFLIDLSWLHTLSLHH